MTNCLNFGNPEKSDVYFQLEQAITGMADAARALNTPVVSGNVSLYNETNDVPVLPTPVVGMIGVIDQVEKHVGMAAESGDELLLIGETTATLGASEFLAIQHETIAGDPPDIDLGQESSLQKLVVRLISLGLVNAAHDCSEGGLLVAISEMLIAGNVGATLDLGSLNASNGGSAGSDPVR